jgi:DHA2 family multidrug resistance protein-like MFS transporter
VVASIFALVDLTYGLIQAGEHGWSSSRALIAIFAGAFILLAFVELERQETRRPGGSPLVDLSLFRSRSFTWGVILQALTMFLMVGVLFTMPQYFQGVLGVNALGSGLRILPLIAGLIVGAVPAEKITRRFGAKGTVTAGFALIALGLGAGAGTQVSSGELFLAAWTAIAGAGMGLSLATATSAALTELSEDRSGTGSALLQAINKLGAPFGIAVLGSVVSSAYLSRLDLGGLSPSTTATVRQSLFSGIAAANRAHSPVLLHSVRLAFTHGLDAALISSAGIATAGALLSAAFLPSRSNRDLN